MNILIRNTGDQPIYEQIVRQIKAAILSGEVAAGEMLPSIRGLAKDLRISVITTKRAYEELEKEGFIHTMGGKGSFVAECNRDLVREEARKEIEGHISAACARARMAGISLRELREMLEIFGEGEE